MADTAQRSPSSGSTEMPARDWTRILAKYREPAYFRSFFELFVTLVPFLLLWAAALWALSISVWLSLAISVSAGAFLMRLFMIQHDCGHGSFFKSRSMNDWLGRTAGVLTLTPYHVWRRSHAIHHSDCGNLDRRGVGDITTLTVSEYHDRGLWKKFTYRFYRHPITLFIIGPIYVFLFENRLPFGYFRAGWRYWISAMGSNAATLAAAAILVYFFGLGPFLWVFLPTTLIAGAIGIWLFYVQHQFEDTFWEKNPDWTVHEAALYGSSHYKLPGFLPWMTGNIGVHHVHHLYSRIPFYRLSQVLKDHPVLADIRRLTLWESFGCVKLQLWDEDSRRLVTYAQARLGRAQAVAA